MTGNIPPVTPAIARTAVPSVPEQSQEQPQSKPEVSKPSGEPLPVKRPTVAPVDISKVAERLNDFVQSSQRSLRFRVDDPSGRTVITVLDANTDEVIREIPSEEALRLAERLDRLDGSLVSATA